MTADSEFDLDAFLTEARAAHALLSQDQFWINVHGRRLPIAEMSVRYKSNVLAFMRKRVHWFASRYVWGEISSMGQPSGWHEVVPGDGPEGVTIGREVSMGEFMGMGDGGNMDHAYDEHIESLQQRIKEDPAGWLDSTPLMEALSEQVATLVGGEIGDRPQDAPIRVDGRAIDPVCGQPYDDPRHRSSGEIPTLRRACSGQWVKL